MKNLHEGRLTLRPTIVLVYEWVEWKPEYEDLT